MAFAFSLLVIWNSLTIFNRLHLVHIDSNHHMVIKQDVMARQMVFREIDTPLEDISIHGAGMAFELAGDNLHPIAPAESVVKTHAMEGIGLAGVGAINSCQSVPHVVPQKFKASWGLVERIATFLA